MTQGQVFGPLEWRRATHKRYELGVSWRWSYEKPECARFTVKASLVYGHGADGFQRWIARTMRQRGDAPPMEFGRLAAAKAWAQAVVVLEEAV